MWQPARYWTLFGVDQWKLKKMLSFLCTAQYADAFHQIKIQTIIHFFYIPNESKYITWHHEVLESNRKVLPCNQLQCNSMDECCGASSAGSTLRVLRHLPLISVQSPIRDWFLMPDQACLPRPPYKQTGTQQNIIFSQFLLHDSMWT